MGVTISSSRELFESWITSYAKLRNFGYMNELLGRVGDDYRLSWVDCAWIGWRAARGEL